MEAIMKRLILAVCLLFTVLCGGFADSWKFRTSDVEWDEKHKSIHLHWEEPDESTLFLDVSTFVLPFSYWYRCNDEIERTIILELFKEAIDNPGEAVVYVNQIFANGKMYYYITACYVEDYINNKVWVVSTFQE